MVRYKVKSAVYCCLIVSVAIRLLMFSDAGAQTPTYSKLVVFGDSLSDTGNLAVIDFPPPFFQNRISDGPVAADLIAAAINSTAERSGHLLDQSAGSNSGFNSGFNYAVAGGNIVGGDREDLAQQVSAYLSRVNNQADPDALYLVFAGGNDVRDLRSITSATEASAQAGRIAATLQTQLNRLQAAGARAFFIPNVANIARLPETLEREADDPTVVSRAQNYSQEYNRIFAQLIGDFSRNSNVSVTAFDLFSALENVIENASSFGFIDISEGCFDADEFEIAPECLLFGFESRVFFDSLHPSSATNQIIAAQMIQALPELPTDVRPTIIIAPILELLLSE